MPPDISQLEGLAFRKLLDYTDQVETRLEINEINTRNGGERTIFGKRYVEFHWFSFLRQNFHSNDYQCNIKIVQFSLDKF